MSNPFAEHAQNTADYQDMLKGDDGSGGATLTFTTLQPNITVDCTYEKILDDFNLIAGGQSPQLVIEQCVFLAAPFSDAAKTKLRKGLQCTLKPKPAAAEVQVQLWSGGLEQGGMIYRFMLVDANYSA
jgi:hypothetical protein